MHTFIFVVASLLVSFLSTSLKSESRLVSMSSKALLTGTYLGLEPNPINPVEAVPADVSNSAA